MKKRLLMKTVKTVPGIKPAAQSTGTITTSTVIDRLGFLAANIMLAVGDVTGAPSAQSVIAKLQHGALSDGSDAADVAGATLTALTVNNTNVSGYFDLTGLKRYIRVVPIVTFTGGTTPTIPVQISVTLGDADYEPVV